ncbi:pilus assembly protein CpaD [Pacificimonas sp. WHA3]|uniref:Pilus assembly protein CpaD n=1 Tax=Pacificimonas pallii TaxID=2827236 RepID=A0ABS6SA39_9SPHN|nr:CpaD family pilus assembly lipoprotein [Pacificimonas pallii]MBV7255245.1 pilus assembly protein CpaD [Pacificimonas pallii]
MKRLTIVAAASLGLLTACQGGSTPSPEVASNHVPTVTRTIMTHDMPYMQNGAFSAQEVDRLKQWLDSVGVRYGDQLSVDGPTGSGAALREKMVSEVLAQRGLMLVRHAPPTSPALTAGTARFVLVRAVASVPECPDFSRRSNPEYSASKMSNYSCATISNLAAMVADPNDLVSGKTHAGVTAERAVKAVDAALKKATRDSVNSSVGTVK